METSITTSKGQILIPKWLRERYGIRPGKRVTFVESEQGILIKPLNKVYINQFRGILKGTGNLVEEMRQMKKEEAELENEKFVRLFGKDINLKKKIVSSAELREMRKRKFKKKL